MGTSATWTKVGEIPGATLEQLDSPELHRLFSWGKCPWTDDPACEQLVLTDLAPLAATGGLGVSVHDDGTTVRVATTITRTEVAAVTNEEGHVLTAFRMPNPTTNNWFSQFLVHGTRFALPILTKKDPTPRGLLGRLDQPGLTLFYPQWPSPELGAGSQGYALTAERWGMWINQAAMVSLDATVGNPPVAFSHTDLDGGLLSIDGLKATDHHFLSVENWLVEGKSRPRLVISDGVTKAQPWFPPLPDADDANPIFANTHAAWFRGFGYQDLNLYEHVELWASPFSPKAEELKPEKVMNLPTPNNAKQPLLLAGGWGRVLFAQGGVGPDGGMVPSTAYVVDLTMKTAPLFIPLPADLPLLWASGVTRTHAWFGLGKIPPTTVVRWKLPPGGTTPP